MKNNFINYETFIPTYTSKSTILNAGDGLFTKTFIKSFTWIGFYPGKITKTYNNKNKFHIMGTINNKYIIADQTIKKGVHMINEAGKNNIANVWYIKLSNDYCLYFAGKDIYPNQELLTCYSRTYGKRNYLISNNCSDPRCKNNKHRMNSNIINEWIDKLNKNKPEYLENLIFLNLI